MDKRSLAADIDALHTAFLTRLSDEAAFDEAVFENMIGKLDAYALITRDQEKIDRRVIKCLFQCYWTFQQFFDQYGKNHSLYNNIMAADAKLNKLLTKLVQNVGW
jgi:hypothetical protein